MFKYSHISIGEIAAHAAARLSGKLLDQSIPESPVWREVSVQMTDVVVMFPLSWKGIPGFAEVLTCIELSSLAIRQYLRKAAGTLNRARRSMLKSTQNQSSAV